ncbi:MAG: hypothetical protein EAZ42_05810 [Verrucomicrobia bacterium]|nr:MAG: hypothetical protein EAZ42_05810 [Verrucomicrobiota bacterium]
MLLMIVAITLLVGTTVGIYYLSSTTEFSRVGGVPQAAETPEDEGGVKTGGLDTDGLKTKRISGEDSEN